MILGRNGGEVPTWLIFVHIPLAILYTSYLSIMVLLYVIQKFKRRFKSNQFSSTIFLVSLFFYAVFRILYFVTSLFEFRELQIFSVICYDFGSTIFYIAFLVFMIYWYQILIFFCF